MSETEASEPQITRDRVIEAFREFVDQGFVNPDDLPSDDQEVINANELLQVWANQRKAEAERAGTLEAYFEFNLERSTLFVEAGFHDPYYLDEVANDWLVQDLEEARNKGLTEIAAKIQEKIAEINVKINQ